MYILYLYTVFLMKSANSRSHKQCIFLFLFLFFWIYRTLTSIMTLILAMPPQLLSLIHIYYFLSFFVYFMVYLLWLKLLFQLVTEKKKKYWKWWHSISSHVYWIKFFFFPLVSGCSPSKLNCATDYITRGRTLMVEWTRKQERQMSGPWLCAYVNPHK